MRFPEYRKPKSTPSPKDGVVSNEEARNQDDACVGVVDRTNVAARAALVKLLSNLDMETEQNLDRRFFNQISQLIFRARSGRQVLGQHIRVEYHFDLMDYSEKPIKVGELHTRVIMPRFDSQEKKNEHRVERIILDGQELYKAVGL